MSSPRLRILCRSCCWFTEGLVCRRSRAKMSPKKDVCGCGRSCTENVFRSSGGVYFDPPSRAPARGNFISIRTSGAFWDRHLGAAFASSGVLAASNLLNPSAHESLAPPPLAIICLYIAKSFLATFVRCTIWAIFSPAVLYASALEEYSMFLSIALD
jgi:hypothetical protein